MKHLLLSLRPLLLSGGALPASNLAPIAPAPYCQEPPAEHLGLAWHGWRAVGRC